MMEIGGAEKGNRTMVDALIFGQEYIIDLKNPNEFDLNKFKQNIRDGAEFAKQLPGGLGRSGYLNEKVIGLPEPGCELAAIILSFP